MEDWTSLGQHKRHPEFPVVTRESRCNSRKSNFDGIEELNNPLPAWWTYMFIAMIIFGLGYLVAFVFVQVV